MGVANDAPPLVGVGQARATEDHRQHQARDEPADVGPVSDASSVTPRERAEARVELQSEPEDDEHHRGQLDARFWNFFAWATTWSFLGQGLLGTMASAAMPGKSRRMKSARAGRSVSSRTRSRLR